MACANDQLHDRYRSSSARPVRCLGTLLGTEAFLSVLPAQGSFRHGCMPARQQLLGCILVSRNAYQTVDKERIELTTVVYSSYKMYYSSYLQVVFRLSVARAGYITNIFNLVSCTWAVFISFAFRYTDTYKWGAIIAMPIQVLMAGLLIHFREPGTHLALLVMVEVFAAMCGAMLVQIEQVAVMAAVPHEHMAVGIALLMMITSFGGAIGQTIATAIWTNVVPKKIAEYLPLDKKHDATRLYSSITVQLEQPWASPERQAIFRAFGDAQKLMVIVGTCALVPCFVWVYMLKNYRLSQHKERKGLMA